MRISIALFATVLAISACSKPASETAAGADSQSEATTAAAGGGGLPSLLQASFRSEADVFAGGDEDAKAVVMVRDGRKMRMEFTNEAGTQVVISNPDLGGSFIIMSMAGHQVAMKTDAKEIGDATDLWQDELSTAQMAGPCSVAGEAGTVWNKTPTADDPDGGSACITSDGILLEASNGSRTVWRAKSVHRGPQDAAQFALPEGVQVVNVH